MNDSAASSTTAFADGPYIPPQVEQHRRVEDARRWLLAASALLALDSATFFLSGDFSGYRPFVVARYYIFGAGSHIPVATCASILVWGVTSFGIYRRARSSAKLFRALVVVRFTFFLAEMARDYYISLTSTSYFNIKTIDLELAQFFFEHLIESNRLGWFALGIVSTAASIVALVKMHRAKVVEAWSK